MPKVLIGAAHTLESPGQVFNDLREADLTRKILKKTIPELEKFQVDFKPVPLDLPLLDRIDWIKGTGYSQSNGDIFVEIHVNDGGKRGIESWFSGNYSKDNKSQILSEKLNEVICEETGYENQGAKSEYDHELGSLLILNQIDLIGTTIELLYIDNDEDIAILKDESKLDDLSKALAKAIDEYIKNPPSISSTTTVAESPKKQSPFSSVFSNTAFPTTQPKKPVSGSNNLVMDREERKSMIIETYKRVLGKEPKQLDLNTYLNQGVSQQELIDKLLDSKEHKDILEDAKKKKDIEDEMKKIGNELSNAQYERDDAKKILENFNKLLHHKNTFIAQLQDEMVKSKLLAKGEYYKQSSNPTAQEHKPDSTKPKAKRDLGDFILKIMKI